MQTRSVDLLDILTPQDIGVAVIDRYTHFVLNYFEALNKTSRATLQELVRLSHRSR